MLLFFNQSLYSSDVSFLIGGKPCERQEAFVQARLALRVVPAIAHQGISGADLVSGAALRYLPGEGDHTFEESEGSTIWSIDSL